MDEISDFNLDDIDENIEKPTEVSGEDLNNVLNDIKIKDEEPEEIIEEPKKEKAKKLKKDLPTPKETENINESELLDVVDSKVEELYNEFSEFLETKADMKTDDGIKNTIPTGIDILDAILGGGFAIGCMNLIIGQPGCGKSMLGMQTLGNAQKVFKDPLIGFLDSEQSTTTQRLYNLGVRNPRIRPYTDITIEKVFKFIEGICLFKEKKKTIDKPSIMVWDSLANTLSEKERETDNLNSIIGYKQKLLSFLIPKYVTKLSQYNICLLVINQLRDKMDLGIFAAPKDLKFISGNKEIPGGNSVKFNAFHLLEMKVKSSTDPEKIGFNGVNLSAKCVKNKLFAPNIDIEIVADFSKGFSNFHTNYQFLVKTKRLTSGAWNYLTNYPSKKFRTKDSLTEYTENEDFKKAFDESLQEAIKTEFIDVYGF